MNEPSENNNIAQRLKKRKRKTNYGFKTKKFYCNICCRYFTSKSSHAYHMDTCHDEKATHDSSSTQDYFFRTAYKTNNKKYWFNPTDVFIENFENEMSSDLKNGNDKFRCLICHHNFANETEYLKHEIIHYQDSSVNNNVHITQESSHENNFVISCMIDNFGGITCISCRLTFASMFGYYAHKKEDCKYVKYRHHKNTFNCNKNINKNDEDIIMKTGENIEKVNNDLLYKSKVKLQLVQQKFYCFICKQMCESLDHLEVFNWWSEPETSLELRLYECYVCNEQFTEEKEFKTHETEHVLTNIC